MKEERPRRPLRWRLILFAVMSITIVVLVLMNRDRYPVPVRRYETAEQIARKAARAARWAKLEAAASYACTGTLILAALAGVLGLYYGARWIGAMVAQQEEVRAKDGLFPLIVRRAWTWERRGRVILPVQIVAIVDANKNPAPVMVFGAGNRETQFELPETIPPDQRAMAHGAQVIQATAASGGAVEPHLATILDQVPSIPPGLMSGDLPDMKKLSDSHVYRLLDEADLLDPDERIPE